MSFNVAHLPSNVDLPCDKRFIQKIMLPSSAAPGKTR